MTNKIALAMVAGVLTLGVGGSASATPVALTDTYWGGEPTSGGGPISNSEIIGGSRYSVSGLTAERVGNDLNVVISTNYADNIGAGGTRIGSLFIGDPRNLNLTGAEPDHQTDTFAADTDRFSYVFDYDIANADVRLGDTGGATLWSLDKTGGDVEKSFGTTFRKNQAIDRAGGAATGVIGQWRVTAGTVTFEIKDFFALSGLPAIYNTSLTLAWTMSCANDVILGVVEIPKNSIETPLPAGAALLVSGLLGLGALGRRNKKS
jgi:hypothetical protein